MKEAPTERQGRRLARWLPLLGLLALMAIAFAAGGRHFLTFEAVGRNYEALKSFIGGHLALALLIYLGIYITVVALSLPGALLLTVTGGLLFGWQLGAPAAVLGATAGATIVFLVARVSCEEALVARAGPWLGRLREGFKEHALSYLLFLRLVPAFPFVIVNLAPAVLGVPVRTFVVGTFFGIMPGTLAFSVAGAGLGSVIEAKNRLYAECMAAHPGDHAAGCPYTIDIGVVLTPEVVAAFVLLGLVALIPVAIKKWGRYAARS